MQTYSYNYKIPPSEADLNGFWRAAAIFKEMAQAGDQHASLLGLGREVMLGRDILWVLARVNLEMRSYPSIYDEITVNTWYAPPGKLTYERYFEFTGSGGEGLGAAVSVWALMNLKSRSIVRPKNSGVIFPEACQKPPAAAIPGKINFPDYSVTAETRTARYADIDPNRHVNNAKYVEWICDILHGEDFAERKITRVNINYINEVTPGQEVEIKTGGGDGKFYFKGIIGGDDKPAFEAEVNICKNLYSTGGNAGS